jgi:iron(III) transport system permease protein
MHLKKEIASASDSSLWRSHVFPEKPKSARFRGVLWLIPIGICAILILYPAFMLLSGSFHEGAPGEGGKLTLQNYIDVLTDKHILAMGLHTLVVATGATLISVLYAFFLTWLVTRTDIPWRRTVETFALIPFLIPPSLSAIGWAMLANPDNGMLNKLAGQSWLNIYSYTGVTFVMAQHIAGFLFLMMLAPFKNSDPNLEDAARLSGAGPFMTFRTVQLPLLIPSMLPLALLAFVRAVESFEVPVILGTPAGVMVVTNEIYSKLKLQSPPAYGSAVALSCIVTLAAGAMLAVQAKMTAKTGTTTITGKATRPRVVQLGGWVPLCGLLVVAYALATSILPLGVIVLSSFFRSFGVINFSRMTLSNYVTVLGDETTWRAVGNTVILMIVCSTICIAMGAAVAYAVLRRFPHWRTSVEAMLATPWAMPGLVFGLAMLWSYIQVPGFYGSLIALGVAYVTLGLPLAFRSTAGVLNQIGTELEHASTVHGASAWQTWRFTTLPLIMPGLVAGWFVLAAVFSRELAASVLLYGSGSEVVSVLLLGYWEQGRGNYVAVISIVLMVLLLGLYSLERFISRRKTQSSGSRQESH